MAVESKIVNREKPIIFKCNIENCSFVTFSDIKLDGHISGHNSISKLPQIENISLEYIELLKEIRQYNNSESNSFQHLNVSLVENNYKTLLNGYALKKRKTSKFNEKQKKILEEKYRIGLNTNRKVTPEAVSEEMIKRSDNFSFEERLTAKQIKSYFSRLASKERDKNSLNTNNKNLNDIKNLSQKKKDDDDDEDYCYDENNDNENDQDEENNDEEILTIDVYNGIQLSEENDKEIKMWIEEDHVVKIGIYLK